MYTVLLPPGVNQIAVKYIVSYHIKLDVYPRIMLEDNDEESDSGWSTHSTNITYNFFHSGLMKTLVMFCFQYKPRNLLSSSDKRFKYYYAVEFFEKTGLQVMNH
jgi:hypothetical protein